LEMVEHCRAIHGFSAPSTGEFVTPIVHGIYKEGQRA
jgi:hypothetical protein